MVVSSVFIRLINILNSPLKGDEGCQYYEVQEDVDEYSWEREQKEDYQNIESTATSTLQNSS